MAHRGTRTSVPLDERMAAARPAPPVAQLTPRELLAKAAVAFGAAIDEPTALRAIDMQAQTWAANGAVSAPYDPETLVRFVELCPHLVPNLVSYAQNIDGFGFRGEPIKRWMEDLDSEEAREAITAALEYEEYLDEQVVAGATKGAGRMGKPFVAPPRPEPPVTRLNVAPAPPAPPPVPGAPPAPAGVTQFPVAAPAPEKPEVDPAVAATINDVRVQIRREQFLFDSWFDNCCSDMSFNELRRRIRWDKEASGWGCIELIRDGDGRLMRLGYVPGYTVRPMVNEGEAVEVVEPNPATFLSADREVRIRRRFRRYVQIVGAKRIYFKAPGDPRVVSKTSGTIYPDVAALQSSDGGEGPDAQPANEILFMGHHWPMSPCSPPRWIPALLSVLGSREAAETNYFHLKNKVMAGGLLFVFGGSVKQGVKDRLEHRIQQELTGSQNTSKILVVEAQPAKGAPGERSMVPQMQFQSLRDAQTADGMFLQYDEAAANTIGATFRLSPMLRGHTPDNLNRATAETALRFAEQQVFEPEREEFDHLINKVILPELGIQYLRFKSNSPPTRSAEEVGAYVAQVAPHGGILPSQIQRITADVLNLPYEQVSDTWTKQPMAMTLAGISGDAQPNPTDYPLPSAAAQQDVTLGERLRRVETRMAQIVTDELRAAGLDYQVQARLLDLPTGERLP